MPDVTDLSYGDSAAIEWVTSCSVEVVDRISAIDADMWDDCAGTENPFTRHAHLQALETSGSVCPATGFTPSHLLLKDPSGKIVAAAPAYIKTHSAAEYGADLGWAKAHERFCGPYYPKLQIEVPFSPFPGPRLLASKIPERNALRSRLLLELISLAKRQELSSVQVTFMTAEESDLARAIGMLPGRGTRFLWQDQNYPDFDSFLDSLRSRYRLNIRRERREVLADGLRIDLLTGKSLSSAHMGVMYDLYSRTHKKYDEKQHLTPIYFEKIFQDMSEDVLLILARRGSNYVGGTLFFLSSETIYAQHWGSTEDINFLHFETAYYQAIDYALSHGQKFVDTGVNGQHKVPRGILPGDVHHAHWFRNSDFGELIFEGLNKKSDMIDKERAALKQGSPFRQDMRGRHEPLD